MHCIRAVTLFLITLSTLKIKQLQLPKLLQTLVCSGFLRLLPIAFVFIGLNLQAQSPNFTLINTNSGLPSDNVYQIFQDKVGFMWLATDEGLFRFDGIQYVSYHKTEQSALAGSNIQQDATGRIWYQNFDGFCYYNKGDSLIQLNIHQPIGFYPFGITQKHVFIFQQKGIDVFDVNSLEFIKTIDFNFSNIKHSTAFNNKFIFIHNTYTYTIDDNLTLKKLPTSLPENNSPYQFYVVKNRLYAVPKLNETGYFIDFTDIYNPKPSKSVYAKQVQGVAQFNNQLWILTPNGIEIQTSVGSNKILENYNITSAMTDKNGHLWIGTLNKGIIIIENLNTQFKDLMSIEPNLIACSNNQYYVITKSDEIYSLNKSLNNLQLLKSNKGTAMPYFCYYDNHLNHLFVSSKGIYVYKNGDFKNHSFFYFAVKDIAKIDDKYYAYAASGNVGLFRINDNNKLSSEWDDIFNTTDQKEFKFLLNNLRGKSIVYDKANKLFYASSNQGLHKITRQNTALIKNNNKPIYANKLFFFNNTLYAHTTKGEVIYSNNLKDWHNLNKQNNIEAARFLKVKQIDSLLLLSDKLSIYIYNLKTGCFEPTFATQNINMLDVVDFTLDGKYLVALKTTGIVKYHLNNGNQSKPHPQFIINQISTNLSSYLPQSNLQFKHHENNIQINFSVLDFITPKKHQIYYAFDTTKWQALGSETRNVSFASLAPGNYMLYFKLNDTFLEKNTIAFSISKPFWQTKLFIFLSIITFVLVTFAIYKWQVNTIVKRNKLVTEKIRLENELNKSMLAAVRSQMNPHFFYNALNTIQSYIFRNDKKSASNYLSMFSKLTRSILEMSEKEMIKLSDEIHALTLYLELEKIRFENNLQYSIEVNKDISLDVCKIPPMLIQPYVENAIKHGLLHLKENRKLHIAFTIINQGYITVTIDDNGIGREKSAALNKIKNRMHQSFATEANAKRLHILNTNQSLKSIEIIDKTSKDGFAMGTTVILNIPYH